MCESCEKQLGIAQDEHDAMVNSWRKMHEDSQVRGTEAERVHDLAWSMMHAESKGVLAFVLALVLERAVTQPHSAEPVRKMNVRLTNGQCSQLADMVNKRREPLYGNGCCTLSGNDVAEIVSAINELAHELTT